MIHQMILPPALENVYTYIFFNYIILKIIIEMNEESNDTQ